MLDDAAWDGANIVSDGTRSSRRIATSTGRAKQRMAFATEWDELIDQARGLRCTSLSVTRSCPVSTGHQGRSGRNSQPQPVSMPRPSRHPSRYSGHSATEARGREHVRANRPLPDTLSRLEEETESAESLNELTDAAGGDHKSDTGMAMEKRRPSCPRSPRPHAQARPGPLAPNLVVPDGSLTLLPLHAAGYHRQGPR